MTKVKRVEFDITCNGERGDFIPITLKGVHKFYTLDESFIGTVDYQGHAYFWAHEYRHYLRDASRYQRRLIHMKLVKAGLELAGVSEEHLEIILDSIA